LTSVFFSYSHQDEQLRDRLETQLSMLKRQGVIETWHDRRIGAGEEFAKAIDDHVNTDDIILLLVSPDFIASDYCYQIEMSRALERHQRGEAIVIPVILRACEWTQSPFGKLNGVPRDGKPIVQWTDIDEALLQVARAVREAASRIGGKQAKKEPSSGLPRSAPPLPVRAAEPRSSNLSLAKTFSQRDKDQFRIDTFEYIARFFENSLAELEGRNPGYEGAFRRVDANRFFATIYHNGRDVSRGTVYMGGGAWGNGVNYVQGETTDSNSMNESLTVEADNQALYLKNLGMSSFGRDQDRKLSQEGAAELLWDILIKPLKSGRY
jgi:hypothetical protein